LQAFAKYSSVSIGHDLKRPSKTCPRRSQVSLNQAPKIPFRFCIPAERFASRICRMRWKCVESRQYAWQIQS